MARPEKPREAADLVVGAVGTSIHVAKEILGYSTIDTTELYPFSSEEAKKEAAKNALI